VCGIWLSLGYEPDPAHLEIVAHRGPDGDGWRVFDTPCGPLALGHRRLAIIDTSDAALQPMSYADGRYWLILNGEIYNFIELRAELEGRGYGFRTNSDSEVLLAAYAEWGKACLERLVGMFALAIWDTERRTLFAARDRFGIKPLYVQASARGLALASEIKQILALPGFEARMNHGAVFDYLASGRIDQDEETMFAGVLQLRGGQAFEIDLTRWKPGAPLPVFDWYKLPEPGSIAFDEAEAARRFAALFEDAVRLHLRSDVPLGACLSGGLDSSSIVCIVQRLLAGTSPHGIETVSACFPGSSIDEQPFMQAVVAETDAIAHYVYPRPEDVSELAERITWHQDEPFGSTSVIAQWRVFEAARGAGLKVILDGQGADEQLAGYHYSFGPHFASLIRQRRGREVVAGLAQRRALHGVSVARQIAQILFALFPGLLGTAERLRERGRGADWLNAPAFQNGGTRRPASRYALGANGHGPVRDIGSLCVADLQATSLPKLLHWEDRSSMAHGLESRVPFLDHRLVEFTVGLGARHKIVGAETKRVLRRAMAGVLPEKVGRRQDKLGFATPEQSWLRGPLRATVQGEVEETLARYPGLLRPAATRRMVGAILEDRRPFDLAVWRIANLGIWGRVFKVAA
jgi:asparagine synthase (glutamine-hydrolysing)